MKGGERVAANKVHEYLVGATIFLLPFLASLGMSQSNNLLGGMGQDASFYPVFFGMLIWCVEIFLRKPVFIPKTLSFYFLMAFLIVLILSGIFNLGDILTAHLYDKTGLSRFVIQVGTIFIYSFGAFYFYNFFRNYHGDVYRFVGKRLLASLMLAAAYSFIEIGSFVSEPARVLLLSVDQIFRGANTEFVYGWKLRSLAFEASLFGTYISAIFPWVLLVALRKGKQFSVLLVVCIGMVILSFSRTAYAICAIQFLIMLFFLKKDVIQSYAKTLIGILFIMMVALYSAYTFLGELFTVDDILDTFSAIWIFDSVVRETSNLTRVGSQVAAWNIFLEHPFLGIGWGQGAIWLVEYYPSGAWGSVEIREFFRYAPVIFGMYPRVLAELGLVGMMAWFCLWGSAIASVYRRFKRQGGQYDMALMVSIIGVLLSGFNMDIFHFWAYWLFLGMVWALETKQGRCRVCRRNQ